MESSAIEVLLDRKTKVMILRIAGLFGMFCVVGCGSPDHNSASHRQMPVEASTGSTKDLVGTRVGDTLTLPDHDASLTAEIERLTKAAFEAQRSGRYAEEASQWEQAFAVLSKQFGETSWQATNAKLAWQTARRHASMSDGQLEKLRELLNWQRRIMDFLGQGNPQAALTIAIGSIERTLELYGENSYMHGKLLIQIARLEQLAGRHEESVETYRQAFATISPWLGRVHPELESIHAHLGEVWLAAGDRRQAMDNYRVALRMASELYGSQSLQFATRANDLAVALQRCGNPQEAIVYLTKAEEIRRHWLGDEHPHVAHCLLNLGTCHLDAQNYEAARQHLERACEILSNTVQGPNRLVIDCLHKLSVAWMLLEKPDKAEPILQRIVSLLKQTDASAVELGMAEYRWGVSLAKQGKYEEAEPVLRLATARLENALGVHHAQAAKPREALIELYLATQRPREAESLRSRVMPVSYESDEPMFSRD